MAVPRAEQAQQNAGKLAGYHSRGGLTLWTQQCTCHAAHCGTNHTALLPHPPCLCSCRGGMGQFDHSNT